MNLLVALVTLMPLSGACASGMRTDALGAGDIGANGAPGIVMSSCVYVAAGSSITLQGAGGYITTASSVTASAFFGNASQAAGVSPLDADNVFSGGNNFISTLTVQAGGRPIVLSTSSVVDTVAISSVGILAFASELHNSSYTVISPSYGSTNSAFTACATNSLLTITTTGGKIEASFIGGFGVGGGGAVFLNVLQDGQAVGDFSSTKGIAYTDNFAGGPIRMLAFDVLLPAPAAGVHTYCLSVATTGGHATLEYDTNWTNLFFIQEIK